MFLKVLQDNRKRGCFLLHEFVVVPDHFHLIITPAEDVPLEKALQYVKGGFSVRVNKESGFQSPIWQESFTNREDYERHRDYTHNNPVKAGLAKTPSEYPYSSASRDGA